MTTRIDSGLVLWNHNGITQNQDNLNQYIKTLKFYGAKGDGITDDSDALITAIYDVAEHNGALILDPCEYLISQKIVVDTDNPFSIFGRFGATAFSFDNPDSCGLDITMPSSTTTDDSVKTIGAPTISGFSLLKKHSSQNVCTGTALRVFQRNYAERGISQIELILKDLQANRHPAVPRASEGGGLISWQKGFHFGRDATGEWTSGGGVLTHLENIYYSGNANAASRANTVGLEFDTATGSKLINSHVFQAGKAWHIIGETEGPDIVNSAAVACDYGLYAHTNSNNPGLALTSCHLNTFRCGVYANARASIVIQGCLFYQRTNSSEPLYEDIYLTGQTGATIIGNIGGASSLADFPDHVVKFLHCDNYSQVTVVGNTIRNRTHGVHLTGTSNFVMGGLNDFSGTANQWLDESNGDFNSYQSIKATGASRISVKLNSAQTIPNNTETDVIFNNVVERTLNGPSNVPSTGEVIVASGTKTHSATANIVFPNLQTGFAEAKIYLDTEVVARATANFTAENEPTILNLTTGVLPITQGQRFKVTIRHTNGTSRTISAESWFRVVATT